MTDEEKNNNTKAMQLGFIFYLIILTVYSVYSYLNNSVLNISFYILIAGLVVFYFSNFLYNKKLLNKKE